MARRSNVVVLDPEREWWVCWRIDGDLCGRSLVPSKTAAAVEVMEKCAAVYGRDNVWLESAEEAPAGN